jgi:hypothetical protein
MLMGVGIDILSLTRLQGLITRRGADTLARRLCTPAELDAYRRLDGDDRKLKFLSARYVLTPHSIPDTPAQHLLLTTLTSCEGAITGIFERWLTRRTGGA